MRSSRFRGSKLISTKGSFIAYLVKALDALGQYMEIFSCKVSRRVYVLMACSVTLNPSGLRGIESISYSNFE